MSSRQWCNMPVRGICKPMCWAVGTTCGTPQSTKGRDLSMHYLRDEWHWLKIRAMKQTCSLIWDWMHCNLIARRHNLRWRSNSWSTIKSLTQCWIPKSKGEELNSTELSKRIAISTDKTNCCQMYQLLNNSAVKYLGKVIRHHLMRLICWSWGWAEVAAYSL